MNKSNSFKSIIPVLISFVFFCNAAIGQVVTGIVTDRDTKESLIGVTILVKGTNTGTITDFNGNYRIHANIGDILVFSFIGKENAEIKVSSNRLNVEMFDRSVAIEEVIIVGYGTQKKESVVGAITNVKGEDIAKITGVTNVSNALAGMVPGLTTLNYGGKPGQDQAQIIIRAKSTWNGMDPLVLVDGVERDMNNLDANEIESISVLKDASATAVFGVRGGNGVILVTTKRGTESKPTLTINANSGMKTVSKITDFLDSYETRWIRNQAIENQLPIDPKTWGYITPVDELKHFRDQDLPYQYPNVNWRNELLKKFVWSQKANIEIRGGTKFMKYFTSLSYLYDGDILNGQDLGQGYVPKNDYSRVNFRSNFDFSPTPISTYSIDIDGATGKENSMGAAPHLIWLPIYKGKGPDDNPVRYEDGTFANNPSGGENMVNPVELLNYSGMTTDTRTDINATFTYKLNMDFLTEGLKFNAKVNFQNFYLSSGPTIDASHVATKYIDYRNGIETWDYPKAYKDSKHGFDFYVQKPNIGTETALNNVYQNLMYQASLNYARKFKGEHNVTALLLFKRIENYRGANFPSYREEWASRLTYDFKNKYLFETNGAYNGSEKFGSGNKFGFFPSMAVGWIISNEPFMKELAGYADFLKMRYSWGKIGSDNNIPRWLYVTQWKTRTNDAKLGYPNATVPPFQSFEVTNIGNPDAKWETAVKNDIALEGAFLNNKLSFNFDYFWGKRDDIFMSASQRNIPPWFGADPVAANIGKTKERGWELELKYRDKTSFNLNYYATAAVSYAKDEVVYAEDPFLLPDYQKKEGHQIGQTFSYLNDKVITSWDDMYTGVMWLENPQAVPGMYRFIDYNGDGYIDGDDYAPYGYPDHPQYSFNFTVGGDYKGWSLMVQLYGTRNSTLQEWIYEFMEPEYASFDKYLLNNVWLPDNANYNGTFRHPTFMFSSNTTTIGSYQFKDGTMWRLKNIELAYNFHNQALNSVGIKSLRLFLTGNNVWLFSHLNEDRETGGVRNVHDNTIRYPMTRSFNAGFNIKF